MPKWAIDPDHSVAAFAVKHMMIANVRGQFNKITGIIRFDPSDVSASSVEAIIDVSSMTTGIRKRDSHLFSADFLEKEKYPEMSFKSTKVESLDGNKGRITGNLTLHGVTKQVVLEAEFFGPVKSPFGGEITMGFTASATINRFDFDVKWDATMDNGSLIADSDVRITLDIEADLVAD